MSQELFCELHGPYPASFGSCPICSGRPAAPRSLGDMEEDTFIGADRAYASASDEEATEIGMGRPTRRVPRQYFGDDVAHHWSGRGATAAAVLDNHRHGVARLDRGRIGLWLGRNAGRSGSGTKAARAGRRIRYGYRWWLHHR